MRAIALRTSKASTVYKTCQVLAVAQRKSGVECVNNGYENRRRMRLIQGLTECGMYARLDCIK